MEFNDDHFDFYKKIIKIRKENPVLSNGEIEFMITEGNHLSYERYNEQDKFWLYSILKMKKEDFEMPVNETYINLLDGTEVSGKIITLLPLTAAILKRIND